MIKVYRSETGQFVLVHPSTQTFIIDEELMPAYDKLLKHVEANHPDAMSTVMDASESAPPARRDGRSARIGQLVLICFLALLPFVWLLAMQNSMAMLLSDFLTKMPQSAASSDLAAPLREDMDALRFEQNRMLEALHGVNRRLLEVEAKNGAPYTAPGGPSGAPAPLDTASEELPSVPEDGAFAPLPDNTAALAAETVPPAQ